MTESNKKQLGGNEILLDTGENYNKLKFCRITLIYISDRKKNSNGATNDNVSKCC